MSSRQLRKLQQQRELELAQAKLQAEEEEEEESEEEPVHQPASKASLFANFAALEENEDDSDEGKGSEKDDEAQDLSEPEPTPIVAPKKAKKSKKKKKAKNKAKEEPAKVDNGEDEIEAALKELSLKKPSGNTASNQVQVDPEYERICALLGINAQHLKVANEMRSLFGRAAVEVHDDPGGPVGRGARRRQPRQNEQVDLETALKGRHAAGKGLPEVTLRRNHLIQGKEDWPKAPTGGLTIAIVDDCRKKDGTVEFRFDHNQEYQALQQGFQHFVEIGDPQNLIALLIRNRKSYSPKNVFSR